jgi:putative N-acetylmannosamine-6-phosphate epimerase
VSQSTTPDQNHRQPTTRSAGVGIFIVYLQVQPGNTIYIRAIQEEIHSVISAEAAAIALAATLLDQLDIDVSFLSDCSQQLF